MLAERNRGVGFARDVAVKSTAQLLGHPLHPVLIPYPFALLTSSTVFDLAERVTNRPEFSRTAGHIATAGLGTAVLAALPGIVDYFGSVPRGTTARRQATQHALLNLSALACFALAESRRSRDRRQTAAGLSFSVAGTLLLSAGGWLGGELVYHDGIAVNEDAPHVHPRALP